jgi:hypothetical protein
LVSLICEFAKIESGGPEVEVCCPGPDSRVCLRDEARRLHRPAVFAQVGEWLKPTDCKSVPPSEVRRFESFPVHHVLLYQVSSAAGIMSRLTMALIAYLVLGVLAYTTLSDTRIRAATLLILGLFAFKSWVRRKDVMHPDGDGKAE